MDNIIITMLKSIKIFMQLYLFLVIIGVTLEWFPNLNWYSQPFSSIRAITRPFFRVFTKLVPYVWGIDLSIYFGFLIFQYMIVIIERLEGG